MIDPFTWMVKFECFIIPARRNGVPCSVTLASIQAPGDTERSPLFDPAKRPPSIPTSADTKMSQITTVTAMKPDLCSESKITANRRLSPVLMTLSFFGQVAVADDEPARLASTARFDVSADAQASRIENGRVIEGKGSIERKNWVSELEQPRGYTVNFPVTHLGWRSLAVRFLPAQSGTVTLRLMGPFEEASKGVAYRQEVFWDDVRAEGTALADGGFESRPGELTPGWQSGRGTVVAQTARAPAAQGTHYARTWHNQTLFTALNVVGGQPVTIHLSARAAESMAFVT